jgi:hypothetical protein
VSDENFWYDLPANFDVVDDAYGDPIAETDDLHIEPGVLDNFVVDEDLASVGSAAADNLMIFMDKTGCDHERSNLGEDHAVEGFAARRTGIRHWG